MAFHPAKRASRNEIVKDDWYTIGRQLNVELEIVGPPLDRDVERSDGVLGGVSGRATMGNDRRVPRC